MNNVEGGNSSARQRSIRGAIFAVVLMFASAIAVPAVANAAGGTVHYPSWACGSGCKLVQTHTKQEASLQRYDNGSSAAGKKSCALLVARGPNYGRYGVYDSSGNGTYWRQYLTVRVPNSVDSGNFSSITPDPFTAAAGNDTSSTGRMGWAENGYAPPARC